MIILVYCRGRLWVVRLWVPARLATLTSYCAKYLSFPQPSQTPRAAHHTHTYTHCPCQPLILVKQKHTLLSSNSSHTACPLSVITHAHLNKRSIRLNYPEGSFLSYLFVYFKACCGEGNKIDMVTTVSFMESETHYIYIDKILYSIFYI